MKHSPHQIAAFTQVARDGSFSAAARTMGVTQSSITQHVAKLEAAMGTLLFIRRRDGVELTPAARELFEMTNRLRTLEQAVMAKIASYADMTDGHLTVIANAPRPTMPLIAEYTRAHPHVHVDFRLYGWTRAMDVLRRREADLAVITEPGPIDGAHMVEIQRTPYRALLRRDHPLGRRSRVALNDLTTGPVILPEEGSFTERVVARKTAEHGIALKRIIRTATFAEVKEAILHGIGTGIILADSVHPSDQLLAIPIAEMPETYPHVLVVPRDKRGLRLVQSFVDLVDRMKV